MSKSEWGNAVWILFHTLACKIDEKYIQDNNRDLINFIQNVCSNLPCPYCASHALEVLKKARLENIKNQNDLKYFFWSFHNIVNEKLNKEKLEYSFLEKYNNAITYNVILNFKQKFSYRPYNDKLLMENFKFNRVKNDIYSFLDNLLNNKHIKM